MRNARDRKGAAARVFMKGGGGGDAGGGGKGKKEGNKKGKGKTNPELATVLKRWEPVIGIEIHAQLSSNTKVLCMCVIDTAALLLAQLFRIFYVSTISPTAVSGKERHISRWKFLSTPPESP